MTGLSNVVAAGLDIVREVKQFVVIKKGEHGSLLFVGDKVCALPSYPTLNVVDPTGAGDSFAGAMMGYLAAVDDAGLPALRKAIAFGTVTASLELEDFSLNRLLAISRGDIDQRLDRVQATDDLLEEGSREQAVGNRKEETGPGTWRRNARG